MNRPQPGEFYYHYKHDAALGNTNYLYKIIGIAWHTETDEWMVVYEPQYENDHTRLHGIRLYTRPLDLFMGTVEVGGEEIPRFRLKN